MKNLAHKIIASSLSLLALTCASHAGTGQFSIGLKFATDDVNGLIGTRPTTSLAPTDVAGLPAVAQPNWNNLAGAAGTSTSLVDNNGNPTTVSLTWNATGIWGNGNNGANFLPGTPDNVLQYTYLDIGSPATDVITVTNLPPDLTTKGYDVYIYALGDTGGRGGAYGIFDANTSATIKPYQPFVEDANPTNYVQCLNVGSGTNAIGNYVVFHGLTNANINIQSTTTVNPQSGTPRAPICAIQIVSAPSPGEAGSATGLNMQTNGLSGQMTISWTPGTGSSGTLVLMRPNAPVTAEPIDGTNYTGNSTFGLGDNLGDDEVGNRNVAVYNGSGNSVTVSNLTPNVRYWAAAYSYNAGPNYTLAAVASSNLVAQGVATNLIFNPPSPFIVGSAQSFSVIAQYDNGTSVDVTPSATVISSNNAIVSVQSVGRLAANSLGTVGVRAIYQGNTNIQLVTVSPLSMTHRYNFQEAAGTTNAIDSIGGANGEVVSSDTTSSMNGSGQLVLSGNGTGIGGAVTNYMFLPADLFTNYGAVTVEMWATENAQATWERLFDFGNSQNVNWFMTPEAGGGIYRTAMTVGGGGAETRVNFPTPTLAGSGEHQFVFTMSGATRTAVLYLDGQIVNINTNFLLTPADLGHTAFDLVGGSQYPDPSFNGTIDEMRIYNGVVDPFQIVLDSITGPDAITNENQVGALNSVTVNVTTPILQFNQTQVTVTGVFANVTSPVPITFAPQTTYSSQNISVFTVSSSGLITATGPGTANLVVNAFGTKITNSITVTALPPGMTHRWSFNGDFTDSIAGPSFTATASGNALISGNQLVLDGSGGNSQTAGATFVQLPPNLLLGYSSVAIETWYTDNCGDDNTRNWARIWDFGTPGGGNNLFVTPYVSGERDTMRTSLNINNTGEWQVHNVRPSTNVEHQLVFVEDFSNRVAYVYVDGVQVGQNKSFQRQPTDLGQTAGDWIGRSQYPDPLFVGSVDELRIYNGTLDPEQIAIDFATGPDLINTNPGPVLSVSVALSNNIVVGNILSAQVSAAYTGIPNVPLSSRLSTWTSSNPSVARVDQYGEVTAVSPGTATISATFRSVTGTTNITVLASSGPTLQHRYSFASDGTDSIAGSNATLSGSAAIVSGSVVIPDGAGFVQFPGHLFDTNSEVTLEAWCVTSNNASSGSRMMDFGTSGFSGSGIVTTAFGLCTRANGSDYAALRPSPNILGGVPSINSRLARAPSGLSHLAWVISDINRRVDFYLNGDLVDRFPYDTRPWETMGGSMQFANILGYQYTNQTEGWIGLNVGAGASGWIGSVDEFRIWNGALNPLQMKVSDLNGKDNASIDPGAAQSLTMALSDTNMVVGAIQHPSVSATFANVTGSIDISAVPGVVLSSDNSAVVAVTGYGLGYGQLHALTTGTAHITATYGGQSSTKTVTVVAKPQLVLTHDYTFSGNANDSVGNANGTVFGGVTFTSGGATFDGAIHPASYIKLPSDLISGYDVVTFEAFYTATSTGNQQRLWDFGDRVSANGGITGSGYIFDAPGINTTSLPNGTPAPGAAVTVPGNLAVGYQAVTVDSINHILTLYTNGVFAGSTTNPAINLANVVDNNSQLGLSQWADPALNGTIREFRIYYGVMSAGQVATSFSAGATGSAAVLSVTAGPGPGQVTVSWPASFTGYSLQMTTSLNPASWVPAGAPTQVGNQEQVVVSTTGSTTFFRLIK